MASSTVYETNTSPLKRSFDHIALSTESISHREAIREYRQHAERRSLSTSSTLTSHQPYRHATKRRNLSTSSISSMLAQSTTIMSTNFPSFMSVYGNEDGTIYSHDLAEHDAKSEPIAFSQFPANQNAPTLDSQSHLAERRGSLTSSTSYSTESSPTTTSSTFDSPLMPEQSPDSSPESASSAAPPKTFQQPRMKSAGTQTIDFFPGRRSTLPAIAATVPDRIIDEPKKNLKNLTLDMKLPSLLKPIPSNDAAQPFSAPTSPLREPLKTGRRKPTNLTIRTPGFNQLSFGANALAVPPTPSQKPVLHQAQSSPSLPSLASPTTGPSGGMRLSLPSITQTLKRDSHSSSNGSSISTNLPSLREEPYQPPQSQETPEKGYTDGPCLIYDSGVYLYLEPTAEEAAKFDTVINVAKEIKNPFDASGAESNTVVSVWRNAADRQSMHEPHTAMSEKSFKSAFEWPSSNSPGTPTTPRPTSSSQDKKPEYLHVKWDHNSEILDDLFPLCRLIDDRIQEGKKVLIHCQLGVSRSASLIIAYGLYKGYKTNFHSMYMAVKERSRWVGPNMSLIYQLTDFKTRCDQGAYSDCTRQPKPEWFIYNTEGQSTPVAGPQPESEVEIPRAEKVLEHRPVLRLDKELPPVPPFTQDMAVIQSEKSFAIPEKPQTIRRLPFGNNGSEKSTKRSAPRGLPFREMGYSNQQMAIPPHRPRIIPGLTFAQPSMDLAMNDVPSAPSLFSPRATEFMASPFGVTTAGDLVTSTPKTVQPPPGAFPGGSEWRNSLFMASDPPSILTTVEPTRPFGFDPRSPHQSGEAKEIFRSIDDVL